MRGIRFKRVCLHCCDSCSMADLPSSTQIAIELKVHSGGEAECRINVQSRHTSGKDGDTVVIGPDTLTKEKGDKKCDTGLDGACA